MKKIALVLMIVLLVCAISTTVLARDPGNFSTVSEVTEFDTLGGKVIGALQAVATIVAIAILLYVGIRFMLASPQAKAEIKGMLIPYVVGAVVIFAAVPILSIIQKVAKF